MRRRQGADDLLATNSLAVVLDFVIAEGPRPTSPLQVQLQRAFTDDGGQSAPRSDQVEHVGPVPELRELLPHIGQPFKQLHIRQLQDTGRVRLWLKMSKRLAAPVDDVERVSSALGASATGTTTNGAYIVFVPTFSLPQPAVLLDEADGEQQLLELTLSGKAVA